MGTFSPTLGLRGGDKGGRFSLKTPEQEMENWGTRRVVQQEKVWKLSPYSLPYMSISYIWLFLSCILYNRSVKYVKCFSWVLCVPLNYRMPSWCRIRISEVVSETPISITYFSSIWCLILQRITKFTNFVLKLFYIYIFWKSNNLVKNGQ